MSHKINPGDRVILELRSKEIYHGTVLHFSNQSIELYDIYCETIQSDYGGNLTFYRNEVAWICHYGSGAKGGEVFDSLSSNFSSNKKLIKMNKDEFERIKEMTQNFDFIDIFDKTYNDAVEILLNSESVGVVGLGSTFQRGKPLSLLLLCNFRRVYIFDMFCLVEMGKLKEILESDNIVKVVYEGDALFDCLYHKYNIEMKQVFDIKIVDSLLRKKDNIEVDSNENISDCLEYHFNFPSSLLSAAMEEKADENWTLRPIIKSCKIKAAQLVVYLLPLRNHLLKKILKDFDEVTENQYQKYKSLTDGQLMTHLKKFVLISKV